jgi:hypothetical protein
MNDKWLWNKKDKVSGQLSHYRSRSFVIYTGHLVLLVQCSPGGCDGLDIARMEKKKGMRTECRRRKLFKDDHFENLQGDMRITLKWIFGRETVEDQK